MKGTLRLAPWTPDLAPLEASGIMVASNCLPASDGYQQARGLVAVTAALTARSIGAFSARSSAGTQYIFAGTLTDLYQTSSSAWTEVTNTIKDYEVGSTYRWEFAQFGDRILATAYFDGSETGAGGPPAVVTTVPQSYVMGTSSDFANLLTANDDAGETLFRAAHLAVVRDFVVFGNILYGADRYPQRLWWSGLGDPTTIAVSATTQADYQELADTGWVQQIYGGETGIILTERGVWRMTYVGAPVVFQFDLLIPGLGTDFPWAGAQHEGIIYHYTTEGFCAIGRDGSIKRIGRERVDRYFRAQVTDGQEHQIYAVADPRAGRILWAYPTRSALTTCDRLLAYDIALDRWSELEVTTEALLQAGTTGVGNPDDGSGYWFGTSPDSLTASPDSEIFKGGKPQVAAIDGDHKTAVFDGAVLTATLDTQESALAGERRALLRGVRPLCEGGTVTVAIGHRNRLQDAVSFSAAVAVDARGVSQQRRDARYHRARLTTSGSFGRLQGLEVDFVATGGR